MTYKDLLNVTDTEKALKALEIAYIVDGSYLNYTCIACGKTARIRRYGVGKNLSICNHCKDGTNIAKLVRDLQYPDHAREAAWISVQNYLKKAQPVFYKKNSRPFTLDYEMIYTEPLKSHGLTPEFCQVQGIGKAKGSKYLGGYTALKMHNDDGVKIGYIGINVKDGKFRFPKTIYPDMYLYNFHAIDPTKEVIFISDTWKCLQAIQEGTQAISNFGHDYISVYQFDLLDRCEKLLFYGTDDEIMRQFNQMKKALKAA